MKIKELRDYLNTLIEDGKGDYEAMTDSLYDDGRVEIDRMYIDEGDQEIWF